MTTTAHVYRHQQNADDIPNPDHAAVVVSDGPWVLVYGDQHDGWQQWGGPYNDPETAVEAGERLAGPGNFVVHEPAA